MLLSSKYSINPKQSSQEIALQIRQTASRRHFNGAIMAIGQHSPASRPTTKRMRLPIPEIRPMPKNLHPKRGKIQQRLDQPTEFLSILQKQPPQKIFLLRILAAELRRPFVHP
jgi:hypothetical protein